MLGGVQAYQNPAEWHVVLTGAFEESALLALVKQLLASIPPSPAPAPRTPQDATPLPFAFPEHPVREDVRCSSPPPQCRLQDWHAAFCFRWMGV